MRGTDNIPYNELNKFDILAHAVPARTEPLGQESNVNGEVSLVVGITGYTNSNQDHSAPYHGYYSEFSVRDMGSDTKRQHRAKYWNSVLNTSVQLKENIDYTGLKNSIQ